MSDLPPGAESTDDPFLWLEDVEGDAALEWVRAHNAAAQAEFDGPVQRSTAERIAAALDADDRIPMVVQRGQWLYNVWQDATNPRGVWRRTSRESYRAGSDDWETVLDVDALCAAEGVNWVWHGSSWLSEHSTRCLIALSRGGADANEIREFDIVSKTFVADGFALPESKGHATWLDDDTVLATRDAGPGTMSDAGYPRQVRLVRRGQAVADGPVIFENDRGGPFVGAQVVRTGGRRYVELARAIDFFDSVTSLWIDGVVHDLPVPVDATVELFLDRVIVRLRTDWLGFSAGSLIAASVDDCLADRATFEAVYVPSERSALTSWTTTAQRLVLTVLDNVRTRIDVASFENGVWHVETLTMPIDGTADVHALAPESSDVVHVVIANDTTPPTLFELDLVAGDDAVLLRRAPAAFAADGLASFRHEAVSADGTAIPYTVVGPSDVSLDATNPTVLYGYGGFEISLMPEYRAGVGIGWLERGGLYVVANIRGGGEFGPEWHAAARKEQRQRCFDDFIAVAEDLVRRGYTSPSHLGISGGSNGGLLVGAVMTQRPDLFAAVSCAVPLLDMRRFHRLLAGASWIGEYGDPDDPEQWAYIERYSPYQNLRPGVTYPPILLTTSTRDDRVHPGHARKMAALLEQLGQRVTFYENIEGGHSAAADHAQIAYRSALSYAFFARHLGMATSEHAVG